MKGECGSCRLQDETYVPGYGPPPGNCKLVVVGEAPGRDEAIKGIPFVGKSGQLLRAVLRAVGLDDEQEVYYTNIVKCRPPSNQLQDRDVQACVGTTAEELRRFSRGGVPILLLGNVPARAVIGKSFNAKARGSWQKGGKVVATWHPAYILREPARFWEFYYAVKKAATGGPRAQVDIRVDRYTQYDIQSFRDRLQELSYCYRDQTFCVDLETSQKIYWREDVLCMAIAINSVRAFVLSEDFLYSEEGRVAVSDLFAGPFKFVGHNMKFDLRFLKYTLGIKNAHFDYDSLLAHYVICEEHAHDLKTLATVYLDAPSYDEFYIDRFINKNKDSWRGVPRDALEYYNALDVCYNLELWHELAKELVEEDLWEKPFLYPIMASQPWLLECELNGMLVDPGRAHAADVALENYAGDLHEQLEMMCGFEFNPRSPKQVSPIVYEHYGAPKVTGRKFKAGSTCKEARAQILQQIKPDSELATWLNLYGQYRSVAKIRSSYVLPAIDAVAPDGRVHANMNVHGARTGRMSVNDPPLHSIPKGGRNKEGEPDWGLAIRSMFTVPEGWSFISGDYSQAELRVVACMSGDPWLIEQYRLGKDVHGEAAKMVYGEGYTKRHRQICKSVNFSQVYGGSPESVAREADMDMVAIRHLSKTYHEKMARLYEWRREQSSLMRAQGYVETCTGRRRRFPVVTRSNHDDAAKAAVNAPVQGSASELTLIALMEMGEWIHEQDLTSFIHLLLTVHDSVNIEARNDYVEFAARKLACIMEDVGKRYFPEVPWKVDVEIGPSWGEVKEVTL